MSTYYDIRCLDCKDADGTCDRHGFDDTNHRVGDLITVLDARYLWCSLNSYQGDLNIDVGLGTRLDPSWFAHHAGHRLAVVSEYGAIAYLSPPPVNRELFPALKDSKP